jgi:hypothetical protein
MRTTSTKSEKCDAFIAALPDVPGYTGILAALSRDGASTSRRLSEITGVNTQAALSALRYRRLVVQDGMKIRLNAALPFMRNLQALLDGDVSEDQSHATSQTKAEPEVLRQAASLLFRSPTTTYVLVGLLAGLLTGPDLRRSGDAMYREANRLSDAGMLNRSVAHGITRYHLNHKLDRMTELCALLAALAPHVEEYRIPRLDPSARTNYGVRHYRARLSDDDIRGIVERRLRGEPAADVAREFGITAVYVRALCRSEYRRSALAGDAPLPGRTT